jgi:hypothetical protein
LASCILAIRILAICGTEECILATVDIIELPWYSTVFFTLYKHKEYIRQKKPRLMLVLS